MRMVRRCVRSPKTEVELLLPDAEECYVTRETLIMIGSQPGKQNPWIRNGDTGETYTTGGESALGSVSLETLWASIFLVCLLVRIISAVSHANNMHK